MNTNQQNMIKVKPKKTKAAKNRAFKHIIKGQASKRKNRTYGYYGYESIKKIPNLKQESSMVPKTKAKVEESKRPIDLNSSQSSHSQALKLSTSSVRNKSIFTKIRKLHVRQMSVDDENSFAS